MIFDNEIEGEAHQDYELQEEIAASTKSPSNFATGTRIG